MDMVIIIGIVILMIAMIMLIFTHSMALQRFGIMEFFTILAVSACIYLGYSECASVVTEQYNEILAAQLSGIYPFMEELEDAGEIKNGALEMYSKLDSEMTSAVKEAYVSACLVQRETGNGYAECYTLGENRLFWREREELCTDLIESASLTGRVRYRELSDGNTIFVITDKTMMTPQFAVIMEITPYTLNERLTSIWQTYLTYGGIILGAATLIYIVIVLLQHREIKNMINLISRVTEGKEDWKALADEKRSKWVKSNEMRALYNGLRQISTDILRINYSKYKALQTYYRFAPKDIEKIMGKSSIQDVMINEQVNMEATVAYISFNINERLEQHEQLNDINSYYTKLGENRKHHNGIIFNSSSDLSTIQMMFNNEIREAVQFGIEMVSGERAFDNRKKIFVLLHRTSFVYGISGDDEQAFAFAHSKEMKVIEKYIDPLRKMGIRMAVTDYVHEMLPLGIESRYVGYIQEGDMKFNLYEVLDAYPVRERQGRMDNLAKFNEAIKLFYQSDFYFARTLFTDILKDCPEDDVAKHYIFRCESCLNEENKGDNRFSLF